MPEIKPVLNKISAFDAKKGTTISFSWSGAQSHKNRIVIKEYTSPYRTVYDCTQKTMALKHTLHLNGDNEDNISQKIPYGLFNGKKYLASVYVYDIYGNESLKSNDVEFYCFSTPIFEFTNFTNIDLSNTAKVNTNSIYLNVRYKQTDGEVINEYKFTLFDSSGHELISSKTFYGSNNDDNLQWTLGGITDTEKKTNGELDYNKSYSVVCKAETLHGMSLSIEQKFVVQKDMGGVGALIDLHSLPDHTVSISSNFKIVNAVIDGEEKYLLDENKNPFALDLSNGDNLSYFDGFNMTSPWSITSIVGDCKPNSILMTCTNNNGNSFTVSYIVKRYPLVEKAYFLFESTMGNTHYILRSDYFPITDKWYIIYLKYSDGYYTFKIYDPEELNYKLPPESIVDKILTNKENIFSQKNMVLPSDINAGTDLEFSMPVDFGDKYNFKTGEYYNITFCVDNIVKNNYNDFTLFKSDHISVTSDEVYVVEKGNQYTLDFYCTDTLLSPKINIYWNNKSSVNSPKEYYNSATYCIVKNVTVKNILEGYDANNIYAKNIIPSATGLSSIQNSINLDLNEKGFYFVDGYKYLLRFSFENIISNGIGIELSKAKSFTVNLNESIYSVSSFEIEYIHNSANISPNIVVSWENECLCSDVNGSATSFTIIDNIDVIDVEHPDILNGKSYQYIFENPVNNKAGEHIEEFAADFRIDTKHLTDATRNKDRFLNTGEEYVLRFKTEYLCDSYYGMFINDDVVFTAEFLGHVVDFRSGEDIEIPFIYEEEIQDLKVHITWNQKSQNYIESKYSKGAAYLLINDIKYGYKELLDDNISDYDYAVKMEINNIDPSSDYDAAYTVDTDKTFTGTGIFSFKDLFVFDENNNNCSIKMNFIREQYEGHYLISVSNDTWSILINNEESEFSYNKETNQLEVIKDCLADESIVYNLSWNENIHISRDLSGGANKGKLQIFIIMWANNNSSDSTK